MNRRRLAMLGACLTAALGSAAAFGTTAPTAPAPTYGATPTLVPVPVRVSAFPTYDAAGHKSGTAKWRISPAGGNCCETFVSGAPTGRLYESGGTYPWYTDDQGKHWYEVKFAVPDVPQTVDNAKTIAGGEGATVVGPDGTLYGVTWDPYNGDHLQAYTYTPQTRTWQVSEAPLHSPAFDRPWLAYAKGPFTVNGSKSAQLLDAQGGTLTKDIENFSPDGLDYSDARSVSNDESGETPTRITVPVVRNPAADWWQPDFLPGDWSVLPLNAGGLLRFGDSSSCPVARVNPADGAWQCGTTPGHFQGVVRQDSRGYLTQVYPLGNSALALATSRNGGLTWSTTTLTPPAGTGAHLETQSLYTVIANGKLKQAVVSARWDDAKNNGHDIVFRVDESAPTPKLVKTYAVGKGDINTGNDVSSVTAPRFDYETIALLPNGKIAVTFDDSSCLQPTTRDPGHRSPEVAILV
jgi:hypothetical protein